MISLDSIWALVLRHIYMLRRDPNFLLSGFYWPLLDILVWGFLGSWIQRASMEQFYNYEAVALLGILLWQVVGRGSNIIIVSLAEELWSQNLVNLFSLPLRTIEWIIGIMFFYAIMMILIAIVCISVVLTLYDVSLWYMLSMFLIFLPPLFFSGIWLGFTSLQIVATLGKRSTELGFVLAWFFLPFSGAYYPIDVLPHWGQLASKFLPMSYVFQGMRTYLMQQQDPTPYLIKGYLLSILYATCAVVLFIYCFKRSKQKGLARLVD